MREGNRLSTVPNSMNIRLQKSWKPFQRVCYLRPQPVLSVDYEEEPELTFGDESVTVNTGYGQFQYFYAEPSVIKSASTKRLKSKYVFDIDADRIIKIQRSLLSMPRSVSCTKG